ncbi:MAG: hypothetical protein AAF368_07720, partial [Planctomycetota bacterium]
MRFAPLLTVLALALSPSAEAGEPKVFWKGKALKLDALPEKLSEPARDAAVRWAPFAEAHELRMDFEAGGALLVLGPDRGADGYKRIQLVDRARKEFEKLVPAWEGPKSAPKEDAEEPEDESENEEEEIPEDPAGDFPWLEDKPAKEKERFTTTTWGDMKYPPDEDCGVLFALPGVDELHALLDELVLKHSWMETWAKTAKKDAGFVVGAPLVAAFLLGAPDLEEWHPDNELIHRASRLLLLRRYGPLPPWLKYGVAWNVEYAIQRTIRCYPNRKGFVFAVESSGWEHELRQRFADYRNTPLEVASFANWPRGKWDYDRARVAFGLVRFLGKHRKEGLGRFYRRLRQSWLEDNRVVLGGNTWERERDFEVPAEDQEKWMLKLLGEDTLLEA